MDNPVRIDKWLWAVRLFKTRSLAADSCRNGKVMIGDHAVKPSHEIRVGEIMKIRSGQVTRTIKVLALTGNRMSAKLVPGYVEDLTPPEEYQKLQHAKESFFVKREKGSGRPTKKDRREMQDHFPEW
jgi:ribosome-associated heat shock protein Hsp15